MKLDGKVSLVSACGRGIGREIALTLAREGSNLIINSFSEENTQAVAKELEGLGVKVVAVAGDITRSAVILETVAAGVEAFGQIDILVNNAGVSGSHPDLLNTQTWDEQMDVNARGVFLGMQAVIPQMQKAGAGSIVNISSISGIVGQSFVHMGYNAAKGAVRMATKAAAVQFAPDGIRVNSVHPGLMPAMRTSKMTADPKVREKMLSAVPFGRVGRVEEVAYANLFLASDESSYITGIEMPVDGGFLAM